MAGKITDYTPLTTLSDGDLSDWSNFDEVSAYDSRSVSWADLKTNIEAQITFTNLYTADGTLTGNRVVSMGVNDLTFGSTGDANLLRFDATADRIGIGTATPTEKLDVVGNARIEGKQFITRSLNNFLYQQEIQNTNTGTASATSSLWKNGQGRALEIGIKGDATTSWTGYGVGGDAFIRLGTGGNNLNLLTDPSAAEGAINLYGQANPSTDQSHVSANKGRVRINQNSLGTGSKTFAIYDHGTQSNELFTVLDNGFVGVGVNQANFGSKFRVGGKVTFDGGDPISTGASTTFQSTANEASIYFNNATLTRGQIGVALTVGSIHTDSAVNDYIIRSGIGKLILGAGNVSNNTVVIEQGGDVGIGTSTPTEKLDVVGNEKIDGQLYFKTAPLLSNSISMPDDWKIAIGSTNILTANVTDGTRLEANSANRIKFLNSSNDLWAEMQNGIFDVFAREASGGTTLRDIDVNINSQYWTGAATALYTAKLKNTAIDTAGAYKLGFEVGGSERMHITETGQLNISSLPTSSAGLSSGDIWLNSNVLTIVP